MNEIAKLAAMLLVCNPDTPQLTEEVIDTGMENTTITVTLHLYDDYDALNEEHVELHGDHDWVLGW